MAALTDKVTVYQSQGAVGKWFDSKTLPPVMGEGYRSLRMQSASEGRMGVRSHPHQGAPKGIRPGATPSPLMGVRMPPRILLDPMLDFT